MTPDKPFKELQPFGDAPIATAPGIAAIALNMAIQYHNINTVQDGQLYQQYKLEGRNLRELHLNDVFETAIKMEIHLMGASDRIAQLLIDAIQFEVTDDPALPETADNSE